MNKKYHRIKTLCSLISFFGGFLFATLPAYAGSDLDLYRSTLEAVSEGQSNSATRRLAAIAKSKNHDLLRITCSYGPCFTEKMVFSPRALQDLSDGNILRYLNNQTTGLTPAQTETSFFTTADLLVIRSSAAALLESVNKESAQDAQESNTAGGYGVYADGDEENSGFDLMNDIDRINEIIFSQSSEYPSSKNISLESIRDLVNASKTELQSISVEQNQQTKTSTENALKPLQNAKPLSSLLSEKNASATMMCLPTDRVDISPSTQINTPSPVSLPRIVSSENLSGGFGAAVGTNSTPVKNEKCGPSSPFCIITEEIKYDYLLFAGGKTTSIDSIFSKHAKLANEYAHADFTPGKVTRAFFESNKTRVNLGSTFSLQVITKTLPMPSANTAKRAKTDPSSSLGDQETIKSAYTKKAAEIFGQHKLKYGSPYRPGEQEKVRLDMMLACNLANTSSECLDRMVTSAQNIEINHLSNTSKNSTPQIVTSTAWNEDLSALSSFTKSMFENISMLQSSFDTLKAKPNSPQ